MPESDARSVLWWSTPCKVTTNRLGDNREVFHKYHGGCEESPPLNVALVPGAKHRPLKHVHTSVTRATATPAQKTYTHTPLY